jgi:hypothetical protein
MIVGAISFANSCNIMLVLMSHKFWEFSDRPGDSTDGFLDPDYGRDLFFQEIRGFIGLPRMKNSEQLGKIMSHKFRDFSDRSSDQADEFLDPDYGGALLFQGIGAIRCPIRNCTATRKRLLYKQCFWLID